jgi:aryl-alcohol dehydrogenase-like predicted oxidoreductase
MATIHAALAAGINYIDTAPSYGNGNSESIIGEALQGRRHRVTLATKVGYRGLSATDVTASVEASLQRLRTDHVDVIQFHGGAYEPADLEHIQRDGLLDALLALKAAGRVRHIGFTTEEAWTGRPLIADGRFAMAQLRYNLIYQDAALHALNEARAQDLGVAVMRPFTSGMLQFMARHIAPQWTENEMYQAALKFLLSDSRVHVVNAGMRWPQEVEQNAALVEAFKPDFDIAATPRMTAEVYKAEDQKETTNDERRSTN